ncbi:MAG: 23S rRNA (adenine(2503)-C(2))-methyltransferase RlmN [Anaerolineae bacterium]|nr:23S rRNA (adenine(2503)-C(2))-methyltransferase RlmN [Anaerolineae bacterium]
MNVSVNVTEKPDLYDWDLPTLEAHLAAWGQPAYRARQIWDWLYRQLVTDFDAMTSLPKALREQLAAATTLAAPQVLSRQESLDGETRKDLLALADGEQVEVVLMHYIERRSACLSTQVGCAMGCAFCATGQMGFTRNLSSGEIVAQALHLQRELRARGESLSNIVLMGMGEPLLNYDATLAAIRRLVHPQGFGMGQRRITLSTVGIAPGIRRLAEESLQINLAISLHAATDALRQQLLPVSRKYPLEALFEAVAAYLQATNRRVTFEWVLIHEVNDTVEQAEALAARLSGLLAHVNLIPLNPTEGFEGRPSSPERIAAFTAVLERRHIAHTVRVRRGGDIRAGCGQLRRRTQRAAAAKSGS